jgi:hypothetical protein
MRQNDSRVKMFILCACNVVCTLCNSLWKTRILGSLKHISGAASTNYNFEFAQEEKSCLHRKAALTFHVSAFNFANVDGRKGWPKLKLGQSEVDRVISLAGQPGGRPNPKKPTALRGAVGVWNCESSDHIKGRDGACLHVVMLPRRSWQLEHNQSHGLFLFSLLQFLIPSSTVQVQRR